ncbi:hypothetical protein [Desulfovibrio sp. JC010]|uniref:hypothetical protein n=1 Tax=Desulfovibrio sp. JC010 TaxID=2593641 RepID=UPI0013D5C655|nr:hypothetical protein [Desulfovibrio sp. JC010]NDV27360.1 hypothetical protein [Desulfovibrio sp. JC010]
MNDVALATPVEGGVRDTSIEPWLPTERPDALPDSIDAPTMHLHETEQQQIVDKAIHSLTGKGNLIDRIV